MKIIRNIFFVLFGLLACIVFANTYLEKQTSKQEYIGLNELTEDLINQVYFEHNLKKEDAFIICFLDFSCQDCKDQYADYLDLMSKENSVDVKDINFVFMLTSIEGGKVLDLKNEMKEYISYDQLHYEQYTEQSADGVFQQISAPLTLVKRANDSVVTILEGYHAFEIAMSHL